VEDLLKPDFEFSAFFEVTPDLVCIAGKDGYFKKVNRVVIEKLGYTKEELFAVPISTFIYAEDKELTLQNRTELLKGKMLHNFINRYVTKNGDILWLEWTSIYFTGSELVFAVAKDITERKLVENEVVEQYEKFKSLTTHFKERIEKDKKYFAYELHEELAQLVAVIKMNIDWINHNTTDLQEPVKKRIQQVSEVSKLMIKSIQRISFSISPGMLDDLGFNTTLEWLCNEFSLLNNIPCSFKNNYDEVLLTHELKTDLFRICQESLTNVTYHAKANAVHILLEEVGNKIHLTITDDGKGFDTNQAKDTPGLTNMYERAASINAQLTIESKIGEGTKICFSVDKPKIH
jgi:PAS domain S-box-containing protein